MLAIRMQRLGRKGLPHYRIVVQDSRRTPGSGRVVATLGSYNPHNKELILDKEKSQQYVNNGAQPSERVAALFGAQGLTLPAWVGQRSSQSRGLKKPDKLRKHQPKEEPVAEAVSAEPEADTEVVAE